MLNTSLALLYSEVIPEEALFDCGHTSLGKRAKFSFLPGSDPLWDAGDPLPPRLILRMCQRCFAQLGWFLQQPVPPGTFDGE